MSHRHAGTRRSPRPSAVAGLLSATLAAGLLFGASGAFADSVDANPPTIPQTTLAPLSLGGAAGATTATTAKPGAAAATTAKPGAAATPATVGASAGASYEKAKTLIVAKDWTGAITALEEADRLQPRNADVQNLLGYSNRKLGNLDKALVHYASALQIDPKHVGAHEYLGETYLMLNSPAKAKVELGTLKKLCGVKCEQYLDLSKAIAAYKPPTIKKK